MYVLDQQIKLVIQVEIVDFNSGQLETFDLKKCGFNWSLKPCDSIVAIEIINS